MRILYFLFLFLFVIAPSVGAQENSRDAVLGIWSIPGDEARFEVYRCGDAFCGRLVYMREPNYPAADTRGRAGQPRIDSKNPDPALRKRPLLGLTIFEDFRYAGDNSWENGRIYNPDDGRTYKGRMTLAEGQLKVRGYIGLPILGRTQTWLRPGPCTVASCEDTTPASRTDRGKSSEAPSG